MQVTQDQLDKINAHMFSKYPWLYKGNRAYTASPVDLYDLEYEPDFEEDIKEALQ